MSQRSSLKSSAIVLQVSVPHSPSVSHKLDSSVHAYLIQSFRHIKAFDCGICNVLNCNLDFKKYSHVLKYLQNESIESNRIDPSRLCEAYLASYSTSQKMRKELKALHEDLDSIANAISNQEEATGSTDRRLEALLEATESLFDVVIPVERLWHLTEVMTFFNAPDIYYHMVQWLMDDYDDHIKVLAIGNFLSDYTKTMSSLANNTLMKTTPRSAFNKQLEDVVGISHDDCLLFLTLRGHVSLLWDLIIVNPDVQSFVNSQENDSSSAFIKSLELLQDIFTSCPFVAIFDSKKSSEDMCPTFVSIQRNKSSNISSDIGAELYVWRGKIREYLDQYEHKQLLGRMPYVYRVLQILSGSEGTILDACLSSRDHSGNIWQTHVLASLLHIYSPPLTKRDLARVFDKSFQKIHTRGGTSDRDELMHKIILDISDGNIATILKAIYEIGNNSSGYANRLVSLAAVAHISLITSIMGCIDLTSNSYICSKSLLKSDSESFHCPNEVSFVEEIILELAETIMTKRYPLEVCVVYLSLCPNKAELFLSKFIDKMNFQTDEEVHEAVQILLSANLFDEAKTLCIKRGVHWWNKTLLNDRINNQTKYNQNEADFRQVSTAKAIYFFQLAQDSYRVQTILDLALVRCLYATRRATNVFPGLVTNPVRPGPPLIPGSSWFAEPGSSEVIKLSTMSDPFSLMDATGREECAVEELLSSLRDGFEIMEVLNVEYRTTPDAMALHGYIQSIEKWLASSTWIEKKIAAQLLAKTLLDGNMLTRYWLTVLDVIVWYNKHRQDSESSWFDSLEDKLAAIDDDSDNGIPISLYTKTQAYKFLEQLESVTSSFMSERYLNGCSKDNIQFVRQGLMEIMTASIYHHNHEDGIAYRREKELATEKEYKQFNARYRGGRNDYEIQAMYILGGCMLHDDSDEEESDEM